jgi:uncharacterized protein (DUF58 family)
VIRTRIRPARPLAPMALAVAVLGIWWLVAHNSGAGWVQALGDLVFGALAIGILGPSVILARARIRVDRAPMDGTAGLPLEVEMTASTRLRIRPVHPSGAEAFVGPARGRRSGASVITLLPARRGLHDTLVVDVATAAPFGLQWWTRRIRVPLPSSLHIAPRRGQPISLPRWTDADAGEHHPRVPAQAGESRGTRQYRSGDNRRRMHWPATAHAGELMVRELEGPSAEPVTVTVVLPPDPEQAERVAEQALGTVLRLLDRGGQVLLATSETSGQVTATVADRRTAGRRLARAVGTGKVQADIAVSP